MEKGDWVCGVYEIRHKITGFILGIDDFQARVCVTQPNWIGEAVIPLDGLWLADNEIVHPDDIHALVDLSLLLFDKEWFIHWVTELGKWKRAESLLG